MLGSGNANIYIDLNVHLENIRAAANMFQYESQVASNQEITSRLRQLEVINLEDAAKRKMEQQQLHVDRLKDQENVRRLSLMFGEKILQIGMSATKLLESNVQSDLYEPIHREHRHERYLEVSSKHQLEHTIS